MVLIVPTGSLRRVAGGLDAATLLEVTRVPFSLLSGSREATPDDDHIVTAMPRFGLASEIDLVPALERMGVVDYPAAVDAVGDFTSMAGARAVVSGAFPSGSDGRREGTRRRPNHGDDRIRDLGAPGAS